MEASPHFRIVEPVNESGFTPRVVQSIPQPECNPVIAETTASEQHSRHGLTTYRVAEMKNGRKYELVTGLPENQLSEHPIVFTTALGTSVKGHNWHTMYQMMDIGFPVVMIGPEGGVASWPRTPGSLKRFMKNLANITISETAGNMHEILDRTDSMDFYDPDQVINIGESRGSMVGLSFTARAREYGRSVLYSDVTAPCFANGRTTLKQHASLLPETIHQVNVIGKIGLPKSLPRAVHLSETINPNPYFLLHAAATLPTLVRGDAGRFARRLGPDSKLNVTLFSEDTWSDCVGWQEIFNDHPFVNIDLHPGNHMTIATEKSLQDRVARMKNLRQELIAKKHRPERINWKRVHLAGRIALATTSS